MKHYEYLSIRSDKWIGAKFENHRVIIDEYAAMGYRYVGWIPTEISDGGIVKAMDLIFERDE